MADVQWITVNGNHIPIYEGEKKSDAIKRWTQEQADKYVKQKEGQIAKNKSAADKVTQYKKLEDTDKHKSAQLDIIKKTNPMHDDVHMGIRKLSDIKTLQEAFDNREKDGAGVYPDVKIADYENALKSGYITVYSSHSIKDGTFVSPSKMMAQDYAGSGKVNSMRVKITDVAWINADEGMVAKVK